MPTRRQFLDGAARAGAGLALLPYISGEARAATVVNDIHSQLNPTRVDRVVDIDSESALRYHFRPRRGQQQVPPCPLCPQKRK